MSWRGPKGALEHAPIDGAPGNARKGGVQRITKTASTPPLLPLRSFTPKLKVLDGGMIDYPSPWKDAVICLHTVIQPAPYAAGILFYLSYFCLLKHRANCEKKIYRWYHLCQVAFFQSTLRLQTGRYQKMDGWQGFVTHPISSVESLHGFVIWCIESWTENAMVGK